MQTLRKMNNVNAIIKEERESDEYIETEMETISEDVNIDPEERLIDTNL